MRVARVGQDVAWNRNVMGSRVAAKVCVREMEGGVERTSDLQRSQRSTTTVGERAQHHEGEGVNEEPGTGKGDLRRHERGGGD